MNHTTPVDRDLLDELIDYARHEAPKRIDELYLGLDATEIEEVITDTLARLSNISLPHTPDFPCMAHIGEADAVVTRYKHYISYLHNILPIFAKKAWERHLKQLEYEMHVIPDGLLPAGVEYLEDETEHHTPHSSDDSYIDGQWM